MVGNCKVKAPVGPFDTNMRLFSTAVPFHISEGFLDDTEKAERCIAWNVAGNILACELDLDLLYYRELLAKRSYSRNQSQAFECGRMQLMR